MERVRIDLKGMVNGIEIINDLPTILPLRVDFCKDNSIGRAVIFQDGSCELQIDDSNYFGKNLIFAPGGISVGENNSNPIKMKITEISVVTEQFVNKR